MANKKIKFTEKEIKGAFSKGLNMMNEIREVFSTIAGETGNQKAAFFAREINIIMILMTEKHPMHRSLWMVKNKEFEQLGNKPEFVKQVAKFYGEMDKISEKFRSGNYE